MTQYRSMARLLADWRASKQRMDLIMNNLPRMVGSEAVRVIKENFDRQGYDDGRTFTRWPARKPATNRAYDRRGRMKGSVFNSANKILYQTGNLKNSLDYRVINQKTVLVGSNLQVIPYAQIHNEGGDIHIPWRQGISHLFSGKFVRRIGPNTRTVTLPAHNVRMSKRQYMPLPGEPPNLKILRAIGRKLKFEIHEAMKNFAK